MFETDAELAELDAMFQAHLAKAGNQDVLVVVRADSGAPYSDVQKLLEEARDAGATHLAIATRQKTEATR